MRKIDRHNAILNLLRCNGSVTVNELMDTFHVSRETIRNDLLKLESSNMLHRTFGGAIEVAHHLSKYRSEIPYYERESINMQEKQEIAQLALRFIKEQDHIILDSSSTCVYLARALPNFPLVVLTNSIRIVTELANKDKIEISCIGGLLLRSSMCFVGQSSGKSFANHCVNSAFISCSGITASGATESHELAVMVKNEMIAAAEHSFLLVDHTKFGYKDFVQIAPLKAFSTILVDNKTSSAQLQSLNYPLSQIITAQPYTPMK